MYPPNLAAMSSAPITASVNRDEEIKAWLDSKRNYEAGIHIYFKYGNDSLLTLLFKEAYSDFKLQKLIEVVGALITTPVPQASEEKKKETKVAEVTHMSDAIDSVILANIEKNVDILFNKQDDIEDDHYNLQNQVEEIATEQNNLEKKVDQLKNSPKFTPRGWPKEMDETLKALHDEWFPKFTEKKNLQARLYDIALAGQQDLDKKKEAGAMAHKILDLRDEIRNIYQKRDYYMQHKKLPEEPKLLDIPEDYKRWPLTLQNYQRYARDYRNQLRSLAVTEENKDKIAAAMKQLQKYEWGIEKLKELMKKV